MNILLSLLFTTDFPVTVVWPTPKKAWIYLLKLFINSVPATTRLLCQVTPKEGKKVIVLIVQYTRSPEIKPQIIYTIQVIALQGTTMYFFLPVARTQSFYGLTFLRK